MIVILVSVLIAAAITAVFGLLVLPLGLIRWRMARLYWHTHEGGSDGYKRDSLLLALPLLFLLMGLVLSVILGREYGVGVVLFVMPVALAFSVALALTPPFKRASIRIMRARYPLEAPNVR